MQTICHQLDSTHQHDERCEAVHVESDAEEVGGEWREELEEDLGAKVGAVPSADILRVECESAGGITDGAELVDKAYTRVRWFTVPTVPAIVVWLQEGPWLTLVRNDATGKRQGVTEVTTTRSA